VCSWLMPPAVGWWLMGLPVRMVDTPGRKPEVGCSYPSGWLTGPPRRRWGCGCRVLAVMRLLGARRLVGAAPRA
jgi:hypothetical protein